MIVERIGAGITAVVTPEASESAISRNQCIQKIKLAEHKRKGGTMYRIADITGLRLFFISKFLRGQYDNGGKFTTTTQFTGCKKVTPSVEWLMVTSELSIESSFHRGQPGLRSSRLPFHRAL